MLGSNNWDGFIFAMSYECKLVSDDTTVSGFYQTLHSGHLMEEFPEVVKCLFLPEGAKFIIDREGYEDVWMAELDPAE
ncbi:hypothetical protein NJH83_10040 [Pseudomonas chlororaphis]|uniref:immunity protein Imm33 domain-containing protein n=1 Tax=Pseudomonas chlororaphis TaxID=587753 RepID=UPI00209AE81C|nr:hypothetical protein [Pseudomonas chlororaphis]MCO7610570.1 hypothetical protein [Pseudomonas chlororaphis]